MNLKFTATGWEDDQWHVNRDRKLLHRLNLRQLT